MASAAPVKVHDGLGDSGFDGDGSQSNGYGGTTPGLPAGVCVRTPSAKLPHRGVPPAAAAQPYALPDYGGNMQVPDTAAALRLPALEMTDTMEEVGSLSTELTDGIRSSARAVSSASHLTTHGISYLSETVVNDVVPMATKMGKSLGRRAHGARIPTSLLDSTSSLLPYVLCAVITTPHPPRRRYYGPRQTWNPRALVESP